MLAARLKVMMGKLISCEQSAFIVGRNMLDSVVVANEILHDAKLKKNLCLFLRSTLKRLMIQLIGDFFSTC